MSLGYAEKLSYREDLGGQLGAPEHFDSPPELEAKIATLVSLEVREASRIVAFTGAGISTSCGIPDFRGPNGIWTLQRSQKPLPQMKTSFVAAKPSYTHQALVSLLKCGKLSFLVSQNVDGLHLRSGTPRDKIAELHGNCFAERCEKCGYEYIRDFEIETVGFEHTKRWCTQQGCGGRLRDHILDWEDALPEEDLKASERHAKEADLALCLGTSLQITPACNLPMFTVKAGGKMVIINLQKTPKDKKASLVIHSRCDYVMQRLMAALGLSVPPYIRRDTLAVCMQQHLPRLKPSSSTAHIAAGGNSSSSTDDGNVQQHLAREGSSSGNAVDRSGREVSAEAGVSNSAGRILPDEHDGDLVEEGKEQLLGSYPLTLMVQNQYGSKWPVPLLQQVEFQFEDPQLKAAVKSQPPFCITRTARQPGDHPATLTLRLSEHADEGRREVRLPYVLHLLSTQKLAAQQQQQRHEQKQGSNGDRGRRSQGAAAQRHHNHTQLVSFVTQEVHYENSIPTDASLAKGMPTERTGAAQAMVAAPEGVGGGNSEECGPVKRPRRER